MLRLSEVKIFTDEITVVKTRLVDRKNNNPIEENQSTWGPLQMEWCFSLVRAGNESVEQHNENFHCCLETKRFGLFYCEVAQIELVKLRNQIQRVLDSAECVSPPTVR